MGRRIGRWICRQTSRQRRDPVEIRELLLRWNDKGRIRVEFLANRPLGNTETTVVTAGVAVGPAAGETVDAVILARLERLSQHERRRLVVVTRDIPLAERCLPYGCTVMNDRGTVFDAATVGERRSVRDGNAEIRALGLESMTRTRSFGAREVKRFADALDRILNVAP